MRARSTTDYSSFESDVCSEPQCAIWFLFQEALTSELNTDQEVYTSMAVLNNNLYSVLATVLSDFGVFVHSSQWRRYYTWISR